jgi:hypothetical protein
MHPSIGSSLRHGVSGDFAGRAARLAAAALIVAAILLLVARTAPAAVPGGVAAAPAAGATAPAGAAPAGPEAIASLAWLAGSWSGDSGGLAMEEHWTAPSGGALLGLHRDVKNGRMVSFEFLRIDASDGKVAYWASPRSAPPTPFRLKELGPGPRVVFENPEHDFPQRIIYWKTDDDLLHARVEGPATTGEKAMEWAWKRMAPAS